MLELKNICVSFRSERQDKVFGHTRQQVLFDVSLNVKRGTCLGILGESGSGKSTMGRVLCGLLKPDSGEAILDGVSVYASRAGRRNLQNKLSVVFQDYTTSANPRFRVKDIIGEGLTVRERRERGRLERNKETAALLELVGLPADFADRFPHELSGSLVYKGRKVALYGGAYAPSYLPNDVDTFACGVNCGNHQIHHPPLIVKVHFFPCVQIAGNFFDLFRADGIHTQLRYLFDKLLLASVQFFNLAVHIGEQDGICPG